MKLVTATFIITTLLICNPGLRAQEQSRQDINNDLMKLDQLFSTSDRRPNQYEVKYNNEFQMLLTGGFAVYKKFVSSQDAVSCAFYPSCSSYALETIQTNGFLGFFDAIDRLTRCNGFSPEKYNLYHDTHLFYDPVRKIH